ncbi:VanZ family protein [Flaviaesturariibacter terrae]
MRPSRPVRLTLSFLYFLACCYLFLLPGDELPKEDWLDRIFFDKWVHIGLFAVLVLLLCWSWNIAGPKGLLRAGLACIVYGLLVEIVQGFWVPNRSADPWDFLADSFGVGAGIYGWWRWGKKINPGRNRGRNQN